MVDKAITGIKLPSPGQIGIVVNDLDKTMEYYSSILGIGPWRVVDFDVPALKSRNQTYSWKARVAFASLGSVELELIHILEGRSVHSEFLEKGREGLHHLGFFVSNEEMDILIGQFSNKGIDILQGGMSGINDGRYAYLDTEETGGVIFELIYRPSS
ncbi:VOC family protein [Chloroflexota bacterium]